MTRLESLLREAQALSPTELAKFLGALMEQADREADVDTAAVGQRGLAAWTGSTRDEDWSAFYPAGLRDHRGE